MEVPMTLPEAVSAVLDGFLRPGGRVFAVAPRDPRDSGSGGRTVVARNDVDQAPAARRRPVAGDGAGLRVESGAAGRRGVSAPGIGVKGRNGLRNLRDCPAGEGIEVLQEKWVLHIVHALLDGPKGFNELGRVVGGCNPTTLTQRLAKLEELGVLHKEPGPVGARCSYSLTEAGLGLERVIAAIRSWASAHLRDA